MSCWLCRPKPYPALHHGVVVSRQVDQHQAQGLQDSQAPWGGGVQIQAHVVVQLVQVRGGVVARDAPLPAEVVQGLQEQLPLGLGGAFIEQVRWL